MSKRSDASNPLVIAHRGGAGLRPENTLAAFRNAVELGAHGVELDVRLSRDGQVVIHHDSHLNRAFTRGSGGAYLRTPTPALCSLTVEELRVFDVGRLDPGHPYAQNHPEQIPVDGERIPTLAELFALLATIAPPDFEVWIELKVGSSTQGEIRELVKHVVATLEKATVAIRMLCFDPFALAISRKLAPEVPRVHSVDENSHRWVPNRFFLAFIRHRRGAYWFPHHSRVDVASVRRAHSMGLQTATWTVNSAEEIAAARRAGVDAICTDRPDRLL